MTRALSLLLLLQRWTARTRSRGTWRERPVLALIIVEYCAGGGDRRDEVGGRLAG